MLSIFWLLLLVCSVNSHHLSAKGHLTCAGFPAAAVTVKLWKNKAIIDETHVDRNGTFQLSADTIEYDYTPVIAVYHDCDDGVKPGQRKLKFQIPKHYVGSGKTYDIGSFNLETRLKHNEERQGHVDRMRRKWRRRRRRMGRDVETTTRSAFGGRDEEPDERNDPW